MKTKITEIVKKEVTDLGGKKISRKEAIKKTGYMAVSAATMMVLLSNNAQAGQGGHKGSKRGGDKGSPPPSCD
ncbi:MAG: hypothetical protein WC384_21865 [Prolixibacteraceae bacterium]|jgi:hypothetical protein